MRINGTSVVRVVFALRRILRIKQIPSFLIIAKHDM